MGTKDRRKRQLEETREKILHAARDLFIEQGFEEVTMRAIAQAIEYTPTAIYHHFESKQDLFAQLCRSDFDHLARHFLKAALIPDPIDRIRAIGEAYLDFAIQYPNHYRFLFMTPVPFPEHEHPVEPAEVPETDAYVVLLRACEEAIQQKRLRPDLTDATELAQILWAALHGLISLQILRGNAVPGMFRDLKPTARTTLDILLRGILREKKG